MKDDCRKSETATRKCCDCRHCHISIGICDAVVYECRVRPPRFTDYSIRSAFPSVKAEWWCGRFMARPIGDDGGLADIRNLIERRRVEAEKRNRQRERPNGKRKFNSAKK